MMSQKGSRNRLRAVAGFAGFSDAFGYLRLAQNEFVLSQMQGVFRGSCPSALPSMPESRLRTIRPPKTKFVSSVPSPNGMGGFSPASSTPAAAPVVQDAD